LNGKLRPAATRKLLCARARRRWSSRSLAGSFGGSREYSFRSFLLPAAAAALQPAGGQKSSGFVQ